MFLCMNMQGLPTGAATLGQADREGAYGLARSGL